MPDINPKFEEFAEYRRAVRELCAKFGSEYWQSVDERAEYPEAFVEALTTAGWLAALIPEEYGGGGLSVIEASVILEEINRSGANSGACHAQMYIMGALLRHGSDEQKRAFLPAMRRHGYELLLAGGLATGDEAALRTAVDLAERDVRLGVVGAELELDGARSALALAPLMDLLVVAGPPDHLDAVRRELVDLPCRAEVVAGGDTRQQSVRLALEAVPDGVRFVLVHDAARPLVPRTTIERVLERLRKGVRSATPQSRPRRARACASGSASENPPARGAPCRRRPRPGTRPRRRA